jgi:hypothetical protein
MSEQAAKLLEQILALPREDQERLASRLAEELNSLPGYPGDEVSEDEALDDLMPELERRLGEVDAGTAKLIPWDQAMADAREALRRPGDGR